MANVLIKYKGIGDILVASILIFKPNVIYGSLPARLLGSWTGLHLSSSSVDAAPGLNHSIACMVAAIGVGHVVAARYGPAARPPIFAMNLTWSLLGLLTCALTPLDWNLGSATLLMSSLNHAAFSALLWGQL